MLYGRYKSESWQRRWLQLFLINLGIDVVFNSMMEVILLRYAIPGAVSNKASEIKEKLDEFLSNVSNYSFDSNIHDDSFSVTDYFFISTLIARKRTNIPESKLILLYRSDKPNDVSKKFNHLIVKHANHGNLANSNNLIGYLISYKVLIDVSTMLLRGLTLVSLQVGVLPEFLQVLVIRILQVILFHTLLL